jgi:hypothetical protein
MKYCKKLKISKSNLVFPSSGAPTEHPFVTTFRVLLPFFVLFLCCVCVKLWVLMDRG